MNRNLLRNLTFGACLTCATFLQAQNLEPYLHLRFENDLAASTTEVDSVVFEAYDPGELGFAIPFSSDNFQEGLYAIDYSSIDRETADLNLIQNGVVATILSTTPFGMEGNAARTFAAWIRYDDTNPETNGSHCIMNMGDAASSTGGRVTWSFAAANDRIQVAIGGGNVNSNYDPTADSNLEDGDWHHVAFTYPAEGTLDDIVFYVDGVAVSNDGGSNSESVGFNTAYNNSDADFNKLAIGSRGVHNGSQKWFDGGGIDDVRIYDFALSETEIQTVFSGGSLSVGDVAFRADEIKAYPNAVKDVLFIETTTNRLLDISVFDLSGKVLIRTYGNSVDMSSLISGMYIINVREDNKIANLKIYKTKSK